MFRNRLLRRISVSVAAIIVAVGVLTYVQMEPFDDLRKLTSSAQTLQITDRSGKPLTVSYQNRWNTYDIVPLHDIPVLMQQAFVASEDKRFFEHHGIDWQARGSALWQNVRSGKTVRGASTITEQAVRLIHPRPRNLWSKWIETFEALSLERQASKAKILEFYLNQIPYASNRRGIAQGARYYFDRDLSTLTPREMLALTVLARAPSGYDLYKDPLKTENAINALAAKIGVDAGQKLALSRPQLPASAEHFAEFARKNLNASSRSIHSTIDGPLQEAATRILNDRVKGLSRKNLHNAAALIADHTTGEILAWVVAGDADTPAYKIDAVTVPRQPGSALKPFLYASAIEKGWTAATMLDDKPMTEAIGSGLHKFKNYSNTHYGRITLREALANSLNIPALLTVQYVGAPDYLATLHRLGFESLTQRVDVYDEGLALGVGEVTLYELVQGYAALANKGTLRPLRFVSDDAAIPAQKVFAPETASLIANILSDPYARRLEFGNNSVLNFSVQTAAKTGTSTDYRDAWAVGFNDRYVAGIWMGNLDHSATDGITGASGPALALRSIFAELNKQTQPRRLYLSPKLVKRDICVEDAFDPEKCYMRSEYFAGEGNVSKIAEKHKYELVKPTDGLQMALDPRIPVDRQKFEFTLKGLREGESVEWVLNGNVIGSSAGSYLWPVERGKYKLQAIIKQDAKVVHVVPEAAYIVK